MESEHFSQIIIDPKWVELQVSGLERRVTSIPERMMRHAVIVEFMEPIQNQSFGND